MTTCVDSFGNPATCQAPLSYAQRAQYASQAGFTGTDLQTILAISQAESGGIANNKQANGQGYGVVQIDRGQHPNVTIGQALDPLSAFQYAYELFKQAGNKFTPWTTYTNGAYQPFLIPAELGSTGIALGPRIPNPFDALGGVVNTLSNPGQAAQNAVNGAMGQVGTVAGNIGKSALPYVVIIGGLVITGVFLLKSFLPKTL